MSNILFITHQLSRTGAPIVMMDVVRICLNAGHHVEMISMSDGELRDEVEELRIPIMIIPFFMEDPKTFLIMANGFDRVFVNTLVPLQAIHLLNIIDVPTIWWIHEAEMYFDVYDEWMPDLHSLRPHITIWAVSPFVARTIKQRYNYDVEVVSLCVPEVKINSGNQAAGDVVRFITVGIFSNLKGQDILLNAIKILPDTILDSCEFLFCGNTRDVEPLIYTPISEYEKECTSIRISDSLPRNELLSCIKSSDYIVIPSREDSMPTVAAEAMMLSVPPVLSDGCGISKFVTDGKDGLVFECNSVTECANAILRAYHIKKEDNARYNNMCEASHRLYEKHFSPRIMEKKLL